MYRLLILLRLTFLSSICYSQHFTIPLWDGDVPNSKPSELTELEEVTNVFYISQVQIPTIEVYLPPERGATKQAVIICPGGGYRKLAYYWEGTNVAKFLNSKGIVGIVLKYRLPIEESNMEPHLSPLMDAQQAMKLVRQNAKEWNIDPKKVGIMGFSAGGHLASTLGTHFDESSRPDFMILGYPVISMSEPFTHPGSRRHLIGENPSLEMMEYYSNEKQIKENTPPTFLVHATDDKVVPVENSLSFYKGLIEKGIDAEIHIYPFGGHGFGLGIGKDYLDTWPDRLIDWMKRLNKN